MEVLELFIGYTALGTVLVVALGTHVHMLERRLRNSTTAVQHAEAATSDALALVSAQASYRALFDSSPLSLWEEDFSASKRTLDEMTAAGVTDLRAYLLDNPDEFERVISNIRIIDVNQATVELYGATDKRTFFSGLSPLIHPDARPALAEEFAALAGGATLFRTELPTYSTGERVLELDLTVAVVPGSEETLDRVLITGVDITARKRIERNLASRGADLELLVANRTKELSRVNAELLDAVQTQEQFLANVRHEMRTPLNSVIGFTSIVAQGLAGPVPEEAQRQIKMANRSGRQLLALVNSVLELNEVRSGNLRLEPAPLDLNRFLGAICETVRQAADAEGLSLRCEWGPLPEIVADAARLQQIVLPILSNALRFTESGEVSLLASCTDTHVEIVVADTGPGIDPHEQERIFEAFHQLQPVRGAKHAGTGLGLPIARELTATLGGELLVESEPGEGSRFIVRIPLLAAPLKRAV